MVLFLLAACGPAADKQPLNDDTGAQGTPDEHFGGVSARLSTGSAIVVIVSWTGAVDGARVEFGPTTDYGTVAPEGRPREAVLLGNRADTEVHFRLAGEVGGEVVYSEDHTFTTGSLAPGVPQVATERTDDTGWGQWVMTSVLDTGTGATEPVIFDADGNVVWYYPTESGWIPAARPTVDGTGIQWLWAKQLQDTGTAEICTVDMAAEHETCIPVANAHHDFVGLEDGSLVFLQSEVRVWEGYALQGDLLVQRDVSGATHTLWDAFEDITPRPSDAWVKGSDAIDWTHCNGLWQDTTSGDWVISTYGTSDIRRVSAETGRSAWVMGGETNEFTIDGAGFGPQHAPQLTDGELVLFDNESDFRESRAVGYSLDETAKRASETFSYAHPAGLHTDAMGDANLTPDGYVAVSYGDIGDIGIWSPSGERVLWWDAPNAISTGQVHVFADLYHLAD